jgi:hypothetical protein
MGLTHRRASSSGPLANPEPGFPVNAGQGQGGPIRGQGFRWGPGGKTGAKTDKPLIHGSGFRGINYNLFALAQQLHPHLSIVDGFDGMQGNGPVKWHSRRS